MSLTMETVPVVTWKISLVLVLVSCLCKCTGNTRTHLSALPVEGYGAGSVQQSQDSAITMKPSFLFSYNRLHQPNGNSRFPHGMRTNREKELISFGNNTLGSSRKVWEVDKDLHLSITRRNRRQTEQNSGIKSKDIFASENSFKERSSSVDANLKCPLPKHCKCDERKQRMTCKGNITFIPKPPSYVRRVILQNVLLKNLTDLTFSNISNVYLLSLGMVDCGIKSVAPNSFSRLNFSEGSVLDLSGNEINVTQLRQAFCALASTGISGIRLDKMGFKVFPPGLFNCLNGSRVTDLSLQRNNFTSFSGVSISSLPRLFTLNLTYNSISALHDVDGFKNLTFLELRWNNFSVIPRFSDGISRDDDRHPRLKTLRLGSNHIWSIKPEDFTGLRHLEYLDLKFNNIRYLPNNLFQEMPMLKRFYLKHNILRNIGSFSFNSSSLTYLDLSSNAFKFATVDCTNLFRLCRNLSVLYLTDNNLKLPDKQLYQLLSPLTKLTRLIVEKVGLMSDLPKPLFTALPSLTELIASSNTISTWDPEIFKYATKLTKLYLDSNKIVTISEQSFPPTFLSQLKKLNLAGNPFACTCDLLWFRQWLNTTNVTVVALHSNSYRCQTPLQWHNKGLLTFQPRAESCAAKKVHLALILGVTLGSVATLAAVAISVLIRYRKHISYCCFLTRSKIKGYSEIDGENDYKYDAFVVYSAHDRHWVIQQLLPRIEYQEGYKLCLYDRDFLAGTDIVDNIIVNMEESRKVILVLSDNFAASEWCKWELQMAQNKLLDVRREILILIKLDNISSCNMNNRLMLLMRDKIYIDWEEDETGQTLFWEKLLTALARKPGATNA